MGYKKTIQRNEISGTFEHNDVPDGEHSVNELRARSDARHQALSDAHKADWTAGSTLDHPAYGNALSRLPRPSDAVAGSLEHYGSGQTAPEKKGGATQKPAAKPGIQGAETSRG